MLLTVLAATLLTFIGDDPAWKNASFSAFAVDMKTGEVLVDENSDKTLVPGSAVKAITTGVALSVLGEKASFFTDLEYTGTVTKDGVLLGNLYLRGGGDPCLGSGKLGMLSWQEQLSCWTEAVKKRGICKIQGDVIGDDTLWEKSKAIPSWLFEDLGNYYGAGASALSFHENSYDLILKPGKWEGDAVHIVRTDPPMEDLIFDNAVTTGPLGSGDRACIYGSELSSFCRVLGTVPLGVTEFTIRGSIPDPAIFCAKQLKKCLKEQGILVSGDEREDGQRILLLRTESPPLSQMIKATNYRSMNLYAEHLLKHVGKGTTANGLAVIKAFLEQSGIKTHHLSIEDGSGLSRKNLLSAKQFVAFLLQMKELPCFPVFLNSLKEELPGVHAKTGSMSSVYCMVGYTQDIAFAFLINYAIGLNVKEKIFAFIPKMMEKRAS